MIPQHVNFSLLELNVSEFTHKKREYTQVSSLYKLLTAILSTLYGKIFMNLF